MDTHHMDMSGEGSRDAADSVEPTAEAPQEHIDRRTAEQLQAERERGEPPIGPVTPAPGRTGLGGWLRRLGRWLRGPFHRVVTTGAVAVALVVTGCTSTDAPAAVDGDEDEAPAAPASDEPTAEDPTRSAATTSTSSVCADEQDDQVVLQDGVPTAQAAGTEEVNDILEAGIVQVDGEVRLRTRRASGGPRPTDDSRIEFHLQAVDDPADTGVVVLDFPVEGEGFTVRTGATMSALSQVATASSRMDRVSSTAGIAVEDVPVAPPFHWFAVSAEGDLGDVCPNVTGLTTGAELPTFGQDEDTAAAGSAAGTVEVTGVDYAFEGVPAEVASGTRLEFRNGSDGEAHELVLIRLDHGTPPVEEFLRLPMQQGMAVSELVGVSIAVPGELGRVTKGDLLLDQPGRYLLLCAISVGTPPAQVAEHPFGPPPDAPPPSSPPHFTRGMTAVVQVTG